MGKAEARPKGLTGSGGGGGGGSDSPGKIFVGGLPRDTADATFLTHFGQYGEIVDSVIMKDRHTSQPRGFGFITYSNPDVVDKVIEDTHFISGKQVEIKKVEEGLHAGDLPGLLLEVLQACGHTKAPVYQGYKQHRPGYEKWNVDVCIYDLEAQEDVIHSAIATRESFEAGIRDAARQALHRVCDQYKEVLEHTPYCYLPTRERGSLEIQVRPTTHEPNRQLAELVLLNTVLSKNLDDTLVELECARKHLEELEETWKELEEKVKIKRRRYDGESAFSESESWVARSLPRKRQRHGTTHGQVPQDTPSP